MIKHIRDTSSGVSAHQWRSLDEDVEVELTSESPDGPIEGALLGNPGRPWQAGGPGPQTIRLVWPSPIAIRRIRLVFEEPHEARTQEFVLRAHTRDQTREIVRQQFTFSPGGGTLEREEYSTDLNDVMWLELSIIPAIDGAAAVATLREWRIA